MAKTFTFALPAGKAPEALLSRARAAGKSAGVDFSGDATSGTFKGLAEGSYRVAGSSIEITVDKKPMIAPWSMVESKLKELFS
jgi:hypothetical protein